MRSKSYKTFMETLQKKVPDKKELASQLMNLLCMERESVHRRLRQNVMFSFEEIELITQKYQISLDQIMGNHSNSKDMMFHLMDYDLINTEPGQLEGTIKCLEQTAMIKNDPDSEVAFAMNTLPLSLVNTKIHKHIYTFAVYKWMYLYGNYNIFPVFSEFHVPQQLLDFNEIYRREIAHANYTYYIFDEKMLSSFIKDILYFRSVEYITKEEICLIKTELHDFLNKLEVMTTTGKFDTGKKVDFFITQMTIESGYSYIDSAYCCFIYHKLFNLNDAVCYNPGDLPQIKKWLKSLKKASFQISESGELQRIRFFEKQRKFINELL